MRQAIVVGGTGMLAGVCVELARTGWSVGVLARDPGRLRMLAERIAQAGGRCQTVACDYTEASTLDAALEALRPRASTETSLVVTWIRSDAPAALDRVARFAASIGGSRSTLFVRVVPSGLWGTAERPLDPLVWDPRLTVRRVVMGWIREHGRSRWLTDSEACAGVLRALDDDRPTQVVGVVEPWEDRPT